MADTKIDPDKPLEFAKYEGLIESFRSLVEQALPRQFPDSDRALAATAAGYYVEGWVTGIHRFPDAYNGNPEKLTIRCRNQTNEGILKDRTYAEVIANALDIASRSLPANKEDLTTVIDNGGSLADRTRRVAVPLPSPPTPADAYTEVIRRVGPTRTIEMPRAELDRLIAESGARSPYHDPGQASVPLAEAQTIIIPPVRERHRLRNTLWITGLATTVAAAGISAMASLGLLSRTPAAPTGTSQGPTTAPTTPEAPTDANPHFYISSESNGIAREQMVSGVANVNGYVSGLSSTNNLFIMSPNTINSQDILGLIGTLPSNSGGIRIQTRTDQMGGANPKSSS